MQKNIGYINSYFKKMKKKIYDIIGIVSASVI